MKKIISIIAVAVAMAAADPQTHDGFFLNLALGLGFQSIDFVVDDWQSRPFGESGLSTDLDVKIGGRIANNTLLHATLAGSTQSVDDAYDDDFKANMSLFGLGATYYFPNNIFITASLGISQFHANSDNIATFYATVSTAADTEDVNAGFGFQVGAGKEWWVSDNWGIGASGALLYGFAYNLGDTKESSLAITVRITATYN